MAFDLTGIFNENEFYSHHYLSAIFENDVKGLLEKWQKAEEAGESALPHKQLRSLTKDYFNFLNKLEYEKDISQRIILQRDFLSQFFIALGYKVNLSVKEIGNECKVPLLVERDKADGAPELWIVEAVLPAGEEEDPLSAVFKLEQFGEETIVSQDVLSIDEVITKKIFAQSEPPRWIIACHHGQIALIDRSKWNEKRMLRFDLKEIFGRHEETTFKALACLLHIDSICPEDGIPLLDTLDENSHKHAFSVSEDLKYALREAIELLGNEAVWYLQNVRRKGVFSTEKPDPKALSRECLRYMYRILFILYVEARPELDYVPMRSDAFRKGYSFDTLRDLEMVNMETEEAKNGYFIHYSIELLFKMLHQGTKSSKQIQLLFSAKTGVDTFEIFPLKTHLFDLERTPILNKIKVRNSTLQRIIQLMSLTRETNSRRQRRGRISYAQLGINQLGAVYEALLSYQGFFAETDLYEVKRADDTYDELKNAYFVKEEDLTKYKEDEKVFIEGKLKKHTKGTFIYRLAGRDREKSASYYTPEVLTKCLVKYALKELLKDKTADEILQLTVCEPAMGSAAFLNEAINQLADAYLQRKQTETGKQIPHDEYLFECQRVKMFLADNNVFGVDLNPVAVELAEVSLWLNCISKDNFVPWFGMQLVCGNSLVGARRQVFDKQDLLEKKWQDKEPNRIMPNEERKESSIYHFLIPDDGMALYKDKVIKELAKDNIKKIDNWRSNFTRKFSESEVKALIEISKTIDKLWKMHTEQIKDMRDRTTDPFYVWGQENSDKKKSTETSKKDTVLEQELLSERVRNSSPYRRLKLAMDYWCALWFWPIEKAALMPSREQYLLELSLILEGNPIEVTGQSNGQLMLFSDTMPKEMQMKFVNALGYVDIDKLCKEVERLSIVQKLADKYRFLHWELEFADVFEERGGFDLVLGNPPWIKVEWEKSGILGEFDPLLIVRNYSASQVDANVFEIIKKKNIECNFMCSYSESIGILNFLSANTNYPLLQGFQSNLYKCFIVGSWVLSSSCGVVAFVHDKGMYDDSRGGKLREELYYRLQYLFQFRNERKLFSDIGNAKNYEISVLCSSKKNDIKFSAIFEVLDPITIDSSFIHNGQGVVPERKKKDNSWELKGHISRVINFDINVLSFCNTIFSNYRSVSHTTLPSIYSGEIMNIFRKLNTVRALKDSNLNIYQTTMFGETNSLQSGDIEVKNIFPDNPKIVIISGPHYYVGNPLFQQPRSGCRSHRDNEKIDLETIPDNFIQRVKYVVSNKGLNTISNFKNKSIVSYYRLFNRKRVLASNERTLITCIMPPNFCHIITTFSTTFENTSDLLKFSGFTFSLVADFIIRASFKGDILAESLSIIPMLEGKMNELVLRTLLLNCLTSYYSELWEDNWNSCFCCDEWTKADNRLNNLVYKKLLPKWQRHSCLRTDYQRRQALIEIDVLSAMALGLDLNDLQAIYRIQFPVMKHNEEDTWYDQNGRIVFTCNKGLSSVGFSRPEWNEIKDMKSGTVERKIIDDTQSGGPVERTITYHAPFDRCDREEDYKIAWAEFEKRFKDKKDTK